MTVLVFISMPGNATVRLVPTPDAQPAYPHGFIGTRQQYSGPGCLTIRFSSLVLLLQLGYSKEPSRGMSCEISI